VIRVSARGTKDGTHASHRWAMLDFYDPPTAATSMSRTTAFPCAIVAGLIASGRFRRPGVNPPERLAEAPGLVSGILAEHEARGVRYRYTAG
jgi:lysine 6-dehydrogenase